MTDYIDLMDYQFLMTDYIDLMDLSRDFPFIHVISLHLLLINLES
jgi:hypothetical protein